MTLCEFCAFQADVIERLRLQYKKDLLKIVDIVLSHQVFCLFNLVYMDLSYYFLSKKIKIKNLIICTNHTNISGNQEQK